MKKILTIDDLIIESRYFSDRISQIYHPKLVGVTDGKAVGTYIEQQFQEFLSYNYYLDVGNSAKGIDLPGEHIMTDIKATSIKQPQSSCPFKSAYQKIYGLGYNLLVFVYEKFDIGTTCKLNIINCTFIEKNKSADYMTTKRIIEMLKDGAIKEDIIAFLQDRNVPGDEIIHNELASYIISNPPTQGYLTISNALQWRLQYTRVINLHNKIQGIYNYDR